jgi:Fe-S-cluster containining protein
MAENTHRSLPLVQSCSDCGLCCTRVGVPPFVEDELDLLPAELAWSASQEWRVETGQPCLWYDQESRRCRHYLHRPQVCRDFEVGGVECCSCRREAGLK